MTKPNTQKEEFLKEITVRIAAGYYYLSENYLLNAEENPIVIQIVEDIDNWIQARDKKRVEEIKKLRGRHLYSPPHLEDPFERGWHAGNNAAVDYISETLEKFK